MLHCRFIDVIFLCRGCTVLETHGLLRVQQTCEWTAMKGFSRQMRNSPRRARNSCPVAWLAEHDSQRNSTVVIDPWRFVGAWGPGPRSRFSPRPVPKAFPKVPASSFRYLAGS
jgi:hypothetical protein